MPFEIFSSQKSPKLPFSDLKYSPNVGVFSHESGSKNAFAGGFFRNCVSNKFLNSEIPSRFWKYKFAMVFTEVLESEIIFQEV